MKEKFLLKNIFDTKMISYIGQNIQDVYPSFDRDLFVLETMKAFETLTLSQRAQCISDTLHLFLPKDYLHAVDILESSLGPVIKDEKLEGYDCFYVMPLGVYVKDYGLEYFDRSMAALKEMTKRFSSEWPVRSFIEHDEKKALSYLGVWAEDENCHVRRLASEGSRPRLPWGTRLQKYIVDPAPVLTLLQKLKNEPSRLVQRSIANNLNDIAKDNPSHVIEFLQRWKSEGVKDIDWITSHACRSLIKSGNSQALHLMGYQTDVPIQNLSLKLVKNAVSLGESLEFSLSFELLEDHDLIIDYLMYFKKANGELKAKVFKLASKSFSKNTTIVLNKSHPFKELSTRKYYEGLQAIQLQINGKLHAAREEFYLEL